MKALTRETLFRNHLFLYGLQSGSRKNNNERLNTASTFQFNVLIKVLHYIANGKIKLKRSEFERIQRARKVTVLNAVKLEEEALKKIKQSRQEKIDYLKKMCTLYSSLLYRLFFKD